MNQREALAEWKTYLEQQIGEGSGANCVLVYDPDQLVEALAVAPEGYRLTIITSPLHLRWAYEHHCRTDGESRENICLILYFSLDEIPFDIGQELPVVDLAFSAVVSEISKQRESGQIVDALQYSWQASLDQYASLPVFPEDAITNALNRLLAGDPKAFGLVNKLFALGRLRPAVVSEAGRIPGILVENRHYVYDAETRIRLALDDLASEPVPTEKTGWTKFVWRIAEIHAEAIRVTAAESPVWNTLLGYLEEVSTSFENWLFANYTQLLQSPYLPAPVTLVQVLPYLENHRSRTPSGNIALLIIDGMAITDWLAIRQRLDIAWQIEVQAVFALLPTITSVSRQALFSGKLPRQFSESWLTTDQEGDLWRTFWRERGLRADQIGYLRGLGLRAGAGDIAPVINDPLIKVAGIVVNVVDELMHHNIIGARDLQRQVVWWAENGYLSELIERLLERFETVFLTSDHGHIEGVGAGRPQANSLAAERTQRVMVLPEGVQFVVPGSRPSPWAHASLPAGYQVLFPEGALLFAEQSEKRTSHGGPSLQEAVVPFIKISRLS